MSNHGHGVEHKVACPWAKLDPKKWATLCGHKPWKDLRSFLRHHALHSHRTKNLKLLRENHENAVNAEVFVKLKKWSGKKGKKWRTEDDQAERWHEFCNIIANSLGIVKPADLTPEWTRDWFSKVVSGGRQAEAVTQAVTDDNVRRRATELVQRIKVKKQNLTSLQGLMTDQERELHELKMQLELTVYLHDCRNEFLSQVEMETSANPGSGPVAGATVGPSTNPFDYQGDNIADGMTGFHVNIDTPNPDLPTGDNTFDNMHYYPYHPPGFGGSTNNNYSGYDFRQN